MNKYFLLQQPMLLLHRTETLINRKRGRVENRGRRKIINRISQLRGIIITCYYFEVTLTKISYN